ncbi:O-antigen polymerase [Alcanivorax sp. 521-1]|uniref:O-antigen polymerase n=1 Tax=Alloalcanivorax profundimaris TaxID=2735259 RepID=A0ABS0ANI0_9GAMM|nr:hypothetical protein [Alloalcanivorax profundimaris]MBF5055679.1 O-antigen polymerase [Alloalcanivorax profundimaris]
MSPAGALHRAGPWLVAAYAGTALALPEVGEGFKVLVLVAGFGGFFWRARGWRFAAPVKLLLAAALVALLSWGLSRLHHPQWAESSPKVHRLTHWFAFLAVAWLLAGRVRPVLLAWGAGLAGLLVAPWFTGRGGYDWFLGWHGERVDFGLHNAQHATLLFATGMLGLIALARRCLGPGPWRLLRGLLWTLATLACAVAVVITQTRGVWLGLAVAALVMLAAAGLALRRRLPPGPRRRWLTGALLAGVLGLALAAACSPIVEQRLADERLARSGADGGCHRQRRRPGGELVGGAALDRRTAPGGVGRQRAFPGAGTLSGAARLDRGGGLPAPAQWLSGYPGQLRPGRPGGAGGAAGLAHP